MASKKRRRRRQSPKKGLFHHYPKRSLINLIYLLIALIVAVKLVQTYLEIREKAVPSPPEKVPSIPQPITKADDLAKPGTDIYSQDTIIEDFQKVQLQSAPLPLKEAVPAPAAPPIPMDENTLIQKVLVIIYNTSNQPPYNPYYNPRVLSDLLGSYLELASLEKGYSQPQNYIANVDIQIVETIEHTSPTPIKPGSTFADYHAIVDDNQICQRVNQGTIDEVWVWADSTGYLYEGIMAGPQGSVFNTVGPPLIRNDCNRALHLMGLNYELHSDRNPITGQILFPSALKNLHGFLHRAENVIALTLDGRNRANAVPGDTWFEFDGQVGYSGTLHQYRYCGNAHWPANALELDHDYDYDLRHIVFSDCADWNPQHTGDLQSLSCTNWDCFEHYYIWWMQNFPGRCTSADFTQANGSPMPDWWHLFYKNQFVYQATSCQPPEPPPGDLDSDLDVDYLDYLISLNQFFTLRVFGFQDLVVNFGAK